MDFARQSGVGPHVTRWSLIRHVRDVPLDVERQERLEVAHAEVAAEQLSHVLNVVLLRMHDAVAVAIERIVRQVVTDKTVDGGPERLIVPHRSDEHRLRRR